MDQWEYNENDTRCHHAFTTQRPVSSRSSLWLPFYFFSFIIIAVLLHSTMVGGNKVNTMAAAKTRCGQVGERIMTAKHRKTTQQAAWKAKKLFGPC